MERDSFEVIDDFDLIDNQERATEIEEVCDLDLDDRHTVFILDR